MLRNSTARVGIILSLLLLVCGPAWARSESRFDDLTLSESLESLDLADKKNAVIQLESSTGITPDLCRRFREFENLWNTGNFSRALAVLRIMEHSGRGPGAAAINWRIPRKSEGLCRGGGDDKLVSTRGESDGVNLTVDEATGNLFAVIQRDGAADKYLWTLNMSTDDGSTWSETATWWADDPSELQDLSIAVGRDLYLDEYLFIGYVAHDLGSDFNMARLRRASTSTGKIDLFFFWVEVFDKGVEIKEISLISEIDNGGLNLWYFAILADSSLVCYASPDGGFNWNENSTGITGAIGGLDAVDLEGHPFTLAVSYCAGPFASLALRSTSSWVTISPDMMMPGSPTAISAWDENIMMVYKDMADMNLRYSASDNGGNSWTSGDIVTASFPIIHSFDVAARKGDGISVVYQEETGEPDTCWHTHCDYGVYDFSPPEPFNEADVITGSDICIERLPSLSGTPEYGMLWISGDTTERVFFDRVDMAVEALSVDAYAIYAATGGTINFTLDAGTGYAHRGYILLGSASGTEPGTPLPGGLATLPLNWDGFSNLVRNNLNTPIFSDFYWFLDPSGMSSAQLNVTFVPPTFVGSRINFAFCLHSPYDYASNPVEIRVLP